MSTRGKQARSSGVLVEGVDCWRAFDAAESVVFVDADAYFRAARHAILAAQHEVLILGWDLHSRTRMTRATDPEANGSSETLWDVLHQVVDRAEPPRVYMLLWDWAILYAGEREPLPRINLDWRLPAAVRLALDAAVPVGGSHHQKVVVIDGAVAFSGGLDLTIRRWDTPAHAPGEPSRIDPNGAPYPPFHDVQIGCTGGPAAALGELARLRWLEATGEQLSPPPEHVAGDPDPLSLGHRLPACRLSIARTLPGEGESVCEIKEGLLRSIAAAERFIYCENQFLSSDAIAAALADRLVDQPDLVAVFVTARRHEGWLESQSMGAGRARFMMRLEQAEVVERVRFLYPVVESEDGKEQEVFVHAKLLIIDDRILRVGSANLNNRSMGFDSECDVVVHACKPAERDAIAQLRAALIGEHLGRAPEAVAECLESRGPLGTVDAGGENGRRLVAIEQDPESLSGVQDVIVSVADPEEPVRLRDFLTVVSARRPGDEGRRSRVPLLLALGTVVALLVLWRVTPLADLMSAERLSELLAAVRHSPVAPLATLALFLAAGFVMFPVTVLILATGITFGPLTGFVYALAGATSSAVLTYLTGRALGKDRVHRLLGERTKRIAAAVKRRGVLAMATVRLIPIAPFSVVNAVAGAAGVGLGQFLLGTLLGMGPGIALMTTFGSGIGDLLDDLSTWTVVKVLAVAAVWVAVVLGLNRLVHSRATD